MFAIINRDTGRLVVESGSKIPEEQRPQVPVWLSREHAEEYLRLTLFNMSPYEVVPVSMTTLSTTGTPLRPE